MGNACGWNGVECCSQLTLSLDDEIKEAYGAYEGVYNIQRNYDIDGMPYWSRVRERIQDQYLHLWYVNPNTPAGLWTGYYQGYPTWHFGRNIGDEDVVLVISNETTDICPTNGKNNETIWLGNQDNWTEKLNQYVHLECKDFYINVCKKITTLSTLEL